jgi:chromosome segregation protein
LEHQAHLLSLATAALYHGHQPPPLAQWDKIAEVDCEYVFGDSVLPSYWRHLRVCHSVEEAQQQYHHLQSHEALILPGGALLGPNWFRPQRQRSQALLVDLETAAAQAEQELQQQQQHYRVLNEQLQSLHHQKSVLSLREKELKNTMVAAQKNDEQHSHALVRAQQRCLDLQQRYHEKKQSAYQILQQKHAAEQSAQVLQSELAAISDNLLQLQQLLQEAQSEQRTIESQWHQAVTHCEQITAQYYTISSDIQRFKVQKEQKENHYQQYIKKQEEIKQLLADKKYQWEQSADPIAHLEEEMGADLLLQEQAQRRLHEQQEQLHVLEKEIEEEQKQQRALATQRDKAHAALIAAQMTLEKQQVHHTHLQEQILDNGWTLEQIREQQPPSSLETLKKEISMYQQQLEDLGPVNLRAIAEYEQQNARYQILQEQCTDLDQATAQIQQALDNLDKEMCTLFDETFHQLQKNFQRLFPLLFGGGKAQLILQQLDNPEAEEEAGVIIQAQPPGKKNASLSLLSGGEKALTAAALLFAFFELNPAPFCLLDEIDAPLDDSNTARLGQMIAKLSEKTQFIIVTHSKVMMEFASNLYGVTMKEPGVSRLVSVSLDEALETVGATL